VANWNVFDRDLASAFRTGTVPDGDRLLVQTPAPNAIEWCARPEFLNSPDIYTHNGSYQMVRDIFELLCPLCKRPGDDNCHYVDKKGDWQIKPRSVLEAQPLLRWSDVEQDDVCPKCDTTRHEFILAKLMRGYNQGLLIAGQRSGKSVASGAYIATYLEHRLINIGYGHPERLQGVFKGPKNDSFEVTLVASTQEQSDKTIYGKYTNARRHSPWFRKVIPWIKQQEAIQVTPKGMLPWRYNETLTEVEHGYLNLIFASQNSNSDSQRGSTRVASFIDELCYIGDGDSAFSARQVYIAQENSLITVRRYASNQVLPPWLGMILAVSSPKAYNDYGMELLRRSTETQRMWTAHLPTWHFNPFEPESRFVDLKAKDPVSWQTNFLAQPPATSSPLIHDWARWRRQVEDIDAQPSAHFEHVLEHYEGLQLMGVRLARADYVLPDESNDFEPQPRIITMDAGKSFDAFALVCGHRAWDQNGDAVTVLDWAYRIVPQPGIEPHFASIVECIIELAQKQPVALVRMDHWNSARTVQDLRKALPGVSIMEESMPDEAMIVAMRDGYSGRLKLLPAGDFDDYEILPENKSPMGVVYHEFQKLQRDPKDKVTNPDKGKIRGRDSDDLARCVGHLHWLVQRFDYVVNENDQSRSAKAKRARAHGPKAGQLLGTTSIHDPAGLSLNKPPPRSGGLPGAHLAGNGGRPLPITSGAGAFAARGVTPQGRGSKGGGYGGNGGFGGNRGW